MLSIQEIGAYVPSLVMKNNTNSWTKQLRKFQAYVSMQGMHFQTNKTRTFLLPPTSPAKTMLIYNFIVSVPLRPTLQRVGWTGVGVNIITTCIVLTL